MPSPTLALAGLAGATSLYQGIEGARAKKEGEAATKEAINRLENTDIVDYNRPVMSQLLNRSRTGLPSESLAYATQGAERAAGAALGTLEDRNYGLAVIGQAQQTLADTFTQLAGMDANQRLMNEQAYITAQQQQAQQAYQQELDLANIGLAMGRADRAEGVEMQNAAIQNLFQGASLAGYSMLPNPQSIMPTSQGNQGMIPPPSTTLPTQRPPINVGQINPTGTPEVTGIPASSIYNF